MGEFEKIQGFFLKKTFSQKKLGSFWEISPFQSYSTAQLLQFAKKILTFRNANFLAYIVPRERNWKTSATNRIDLRGRFCFQISNMAENNKSIQCSMYGFCEAFVFGSSFWVVQFINVKSKSKNKWGRLYLCKHWLLVLQNTKKEIMFNFGYCDP